MASPLNLAHCRQPAPIEFPQPFIRQYHYCEITISIYMSHGGHDWDQLNAKRDYGWISIHVSREGHDVIMRLRVLSLVYFNPRVP